MEKCIIIYQSTKMRSHQSHLKTFASTETNPHQQSPEYTQHAPKTRTHGEHAPSHAPVHTTSTYQRPLGCSGQRYAKAAHTDKRRGAKPTGESSVHTGSTQSPPLVVDHPIRHEHAPAQSAQPPPGKLETPKQTQNILMVKVYQSGHNVRKSKK